MNLKVKKSDILAWEKELSDKVWYKRHFNMLCRITYENEEIHPEALKGALEAAQQMRDIYGKDNLGPYSDFEWGILLGKLIAIRWVLGGDRNKAEILDT